MAERMPSANDNGRYESGITVVDFITLSPAELSPLF
jgi:hypothetical protein